MVYIAKVKACFATYTGFMYSFREPKFECVWTLVKNLKWWPACSRCRWTVGVSSVYAWEEPALCHGIAKFKILFRGKISKNIFLIPHFWKNIAPSTWLDYSSNIWIFFLRSLCSAMSLYNLAKKSYNVILTSLTNRARL